MSPDWIDLELRVLAHREAVISSPPTTSNDLYRQDAARIFGVPLAQVTEAQRRYAKSRRYALAYGACSDNLMGLVSGNGHKTRFPTDGSAVANLP